MKYFPWREFTVGLAFSGMSWKSLMENWMLMAASELGGVCHNFSGVQFTFRDLGVHLGITWAQWAKLNALKGVFLKFVLHKFLLNTKVIYQKIFIRILLCPVGQWWSQGNASSSRTGIIAQNVEWGWSFVLNVLSVLGPVLGKDRGTQPVEREDLETALPCPLPLWAQNQAGIAEVGMICVKTLVWSAGPGLWLVLIPVNWYSCEDEMLHLN